MSALDESFAFRNSSAVILRSPIKKIIYNRTKKKKRNLMRCVLDRWKWHIKIECPSKREKKQKNVETAFIFISIHIFCSVFVVKWMAVENTLKSKNLIIVCYWTINGIHLNDTNGKFSEISATWTMWRKISYWKLYDMTTQCAHEIIRVLSVSLFLFVIGDFYTCEYFMTFNFECWSWIHAKNP